MYLAKLLPLLLVLLASQAKAAPEIDLSSRIAAGKWTLAYSRVGEFKPLHYRKKETGTSDTCIEGNAHTAIVDWIRGKGCTVERESLASGVYRLDGQCRLSWWKSRPIAVSVELRPESPHRFRLDIKTRGDALLDFSEQTTATHAGACDKPSAAETQQDHAAQR